MIIWIISVDYQIVMNDTFIQQIHPVGPEKLEDDAVEDAELEFDDIEVHTMDGVTIGNINNIVKGIPNEKLFGEKVPSDQPLQHGVEAPDCTFLKHESQRDILLRLSEKKISVDEAINKYTTTSRRYKVPSDKHSTEVVEVLHYIKNSSDKIVEGRNREEVYKPLFKIFNLVPTYLLSRWMINSSNN